MSEQAYCEICGTFPADDGGGKGARLRCEIERAHEEIGRLRNVVTARNEERVSLTANRNEWMAEASRIAWQRNVLAVIVFVNAILWLTVGR
jgi:hypothetical protein